MSRPFHTFAGLWSIALAAACARSAPPPQTVPDTVPAPRPPVAVREPVVVRDREQDRRLSAAEFALLAKDAQMHELSQAEQLLKLSGDEFAAENYGGALYLANQAKSAARAGETRVAAERLTPRPGEVTFEVPVPLRVVSRGNVREGPGANFPVVFTLEAGTPVSGHSYANDWVRIVDDDGRAGWIARGLVTGR